MKAVVWLFLFAGTVGCFGPSMSCYAETTEEMLSACRPITQAKISNGNIDIKQDFSSGLCWGAFGSFPALLNMVGANHEPLLHVCLPKDATRTQLIAIFVKYADEHPEGHNKNFALEAANALLKAFPCEVNH
jgi:hypothetical protein